MHPVAAWFIGAAYISYRYGYKCHMLPKPHRFIALTALVSIASLISMSNQTVGSLFAYGSMLSMFLYGESHKQTIECDTITPTVISTGQPKKSANTGMTTTPNTATNPNLNFIPAPMGPGGIIGRLLP